MEGNQSVGTAPGLTERQAMLAAARQTLGALRGVLWKAGTADLGELLGEVDALGQACDAARVAVVGEAVERGETGSGPAAATITEWVIHHAPSLRAGGARQAVDLAVAFQKTVNSPVRDAVDLGLPVRSAAVVVSEFERLAPSLVDGAGPHVMAGLIAVATDDGPRECRRLRPALLARYGLVGELQTEQDFAKRHVALCQPQDTGAGVFEYRMQLDLEGKEILEAAIGPLSAPRPSDGEPDLRGSDRRRGDALIEIVQRAVASAQDVPTTAKAQLFVTIDYEALRSRLGETGTASRSAGEPRIAPVLRAGATVGGPGAGSLLAPETVRRLACEASIIPVLLGGDGEVLDWGLEKRLFTPGQTKRLWLRDGGCTYPGCTMPPQWTQAHHLIHWADFGPSDLTNAALLCRHHHTTVHSRRLAGALVNGDGGVRVEWDLTRGSYDQLLAQRAAQEPA